MLAGYTAKVKKWGSENKGDLTLAVSFFLVAVIAFGLGRLSVLIENQGEGGVSAVFPEEIGISRVGKEEIDKTVENGGRDKTDVAAKTDNLGALLYVGSKNSNKYHLPDCPGALRIKEENKIWFSSKKEAEDLGYTPATNCKGL